MQIRALPNGAMLVAEHHHFDPDRFLAATPSTEHAYAAFLGRELGRQNALVLVAERTAAQRACSTTS